MPSDTKSMHIGYVQLVRVTGEAKLRLISLRDAVSEDTEEQDEQDAEPKGFSEASSGDADALLSKMGLAQFDGNLMEPIVVPPGQPACEEFDYSCYPTEDAGTPAFMNHHKQQLAKFGVMFGRGGFAA